MVYCGQSQYQGKLPDRPQNLKDLEKGMFRRFGRYNFGATFPPRAQQRHIAPDSEYKAKPSSQRHRQATCLERQSSLVEVRRERNKVLEVSPDTSYKVTTKHFYQEIDSSWTATMIVACYFVAGLVDSVSYRIWSTFVNMQTGNTILLALRIAGQPERHHPYNFTKCLVSVSAYLVGALLFNVLHRAPTSISSPIPPPLSRWTLILSFCIQAWALASVAIMAHTHTISVDPHVGGTFSAGSPTSPGNNYRDLAAIALLAAEAAGQVCLSRVLVVNELPTLVISTLYHDLVADALGSVRCWRESERLWDFAVAQKRQIRRLACIVALFGGALAGGFLFKSRAGLAGAMWAAAGVKVGICIAWCAWRKKEFEETEVEKVDH